MSGNIPDPVKIYHIVHIDNLPAILMEGRLLCDAEMHRRASGVKTVVGMGKIKRRRLEELHLSSHPDLHVGDCVPFYFCPRSVMLYIFYKDNHEEIDYHGGQEPIIHLVADMHKTIDWAKLKSARWAFTDSNAGSFWFDDYNNLSDLDKIDWNAVATSSWGVAQDKKQAEFLVEREFSWDLIEGIGVYSEKQYRQVSSILATAQHRPRIAVKQNWYY
jgi:hypothetical protein